MRVLIDSFEVQIGIYDSDMAGTSKRDVNALGARKLAAALLEAADMVGHIPSRGRVADTC